MLANDRTFKYHHATSFHFLSFGLLFIRLIFEDNESALFSVTLFKKVVDEFKHHAREKR